MTSTNTVVANAPIDDWSRKFNNAKACNAGKAMVARRGRYWYYAWADGSQNGEEGPFHTEEQATIAAKQDGFKIANAAINAKIKVGDEVRVWQYPIRGRYGKVVKVGLMEYDVEVDGKVYPGIDYRMVVKMPAANACTSTNSVVRNAMAARRVAKNVRLVPFDRHAVKPGDSVWYKGREFEYKGMRGPKAELEDIFDGETEIVGIFDRDLKMEANAQRTARNASRYEEKSFENGEVKVSLSDYGNKPIYEVHIYTDGIFPALSIGDKGKKCVAQARAVLSALERKTSAMKQAIAWMEQNAKNW